jgi:hypothetical protein
MWRPVYAMREWFRVDRCQFLIVVENLERTTEEKPSALPKLWLLAETSCRSGGRERRGDGSGGAEDFDELVTVVVGNPDIPAGIDSEVEGIV